MIQLILILSRFNPPNHSLHPNWPLLLSSLSPSFFRHKSSSQDRSLFQKTSTVPVSRSRPLELNHRIPYSLALGAPRSLLMGAFFSTELAPFRTSLSYLCSPRRVRLLRSLGNIPPLKKAWEFSRIRLFQEVRREDRRQSGAPTFLGRKFPEGGELR